MNLSWYTVTYDIGYAAGTDPISQGYSVLEDIALPDLSDDREGYIFDGWFIAGIRVTGPQPAGDYNLVAHWTPIELTVSYNMNCDTYCGLFDHDTFTIESGFWLAEAYTYYDGDIWYVFDGWSTTPTDAGADVHIVNNATDIRDYLTSSSPTLTLFARWAPLP